MQRRVALWMIRHFACSLISKEPVMFAYASLVLLHNVSLFCSASTVIREGFVCWCSLGVSRQPGMCLTNKNLNNKTIFPLGRIVKPSQILFQWSRLLQGLLEMLQEAEFGRQKLWTGPVCTLFYETWDKDTHKLSLTKAETSVSAGACLPQSTQLIQFWVNTCGLWSWCCWCDGV